MRAVLFAVLVVLACTLSVSASSADWSAPEALWSSDLSASELEARHSEFLMAASATGSSSSSSSSTGPANVSSSSSSTFAGVVIPPVEIPPLTVDLNIDTSACTANSTDPKCAFSEEGKGALNNLLSNSFGFPDLIRFPGEEFVATFTTKNGSVSSSTGAAAVDAFASSSTAAGRRLLQAGGVSAAFNFIGSPVDGGIHARQIYSAFASSLECTDAACQEAVKAKFNLPGSVADAPVFATLKDNIVPGSLVIDPKVVEAGSNDALNQNGGNERNVDSVGGPRNTNVGYYVLGAVLLAFIVAALIYFIVHKKPTETVVKEEPLRRDEVALAPVVAAPAAAHSGVVVAEEQPLAAGQQQMDYRSVFALKHNVLDKNAEQKAAEEDEHNHNDVHFILHQ